MVYKSEERFLKESALLILETSLHAFFKIFSDSTLTSSSYNILVREGIVPNEK